MADGLPQGDAARPPRGLKPTMIVLTILYVLALAPAGLLAMVSPMMADEGWTLSAGIAMAAAISLPIILLMSPLAAWIAYNSRQKWRTAWVAILAPLAWAVVLGFYFSLTP
jgi:hypothetical protein